MSVVYRLYQRVVIKAATVVIKAATVVAVATSILPHMFSTRSRRVSNARLFVGAAASVRLSRAPHFSGGDEHPAALGQAVFFSAVASSNLPRSTSYTKNKQKGVRLLL